MKSFTITIQDNKESVFIEMMRSLNFVKKIEEVSDTDIPEEHKAIVLNRLKNIEENPESFLNWEDIEQKLKL